jgi:hypothetical protein
MKMLKIISAEERLKEKRGHKIVVCGKSGVGKTTLVRTLDINKTLFMDLEAGDAAIEGVSVDVIRPRTWAECRDFACLLGGPNPSFSDEMCYSKLHYDQVCQTYGDPSDLLSKYDTIFVDSITVAGRLCFLYSQNHEENKSERTGKIDIRNVYGMHGREMMGWLTHLQHIRDKNVIFVGILDIKVDDYGRETYELQIEGSKTGRELPGIVDEVITMTVLQDENGSPYRAFVCHTLNQWGYPAKDRSGTLDLLEKPNLGELLEKMNRVVHNKPLDFVDPNQITQTQPQANEVQNA